MRSEQETDKALHTVICERFGVRYPIFGFSHSADVVVAVCEAGGIGVWGGTRDTPEEIKATLADIGARVDGRSFGVALVLRAGMPERNNREDIEALLPDEHRTFVDQLWERYQVPRAGQRGTPVLGTTGALAVARHTGVTGLAVL